MEQFDTMKEKSQGVWSSVVDRGKQQSAPVQEVGVTAAAGLGGAAILGATSKLGIAALLTYPATAVTIGAVGGGILGWRYIRNRLKAGGHEVMGASTIDINVPPIDLVEPVVVPGEA